jgi:starch-binding outer membrane protein, SusD/RagB family
MKISIKKFQKLITIGLIGLMIGFSGCKVDDLNDPNGSSLGGVLNAASRSDLQTLINGIESLLGKEVGFYYDVTGIIGREMYFFTGSDPRYTGELLGKNESTLDNAGFYGTRPYAGRYRTVKNANILLQAVENNAKDLSLTDEEVNGYKGFAKTIQAYELLLALNLQYQNGIRLDVSDPANLGDFQSYDASLAGIADLLDDASNNLASAGGSFPFTTSSGFGDFNDPTSFATFNQALAARVAIYQGDKTTARAALGRSFFNLAGDFSFGPFRPYSIAGGEQSNQVFRPTNQADALVAHPDFIASLDPADTRNSKIEERDTPISLDGLSSTHDVVVFNSLEASIPLITNEELILIYAEAQIGNDNTEAVAALDVIRTGNGLSVYTGGTSDSELVDELLVQRRFSLFGHGHRWVDMRRYDRLDQLPLDRPGDNVWEQLPRPVSEVE